MRRLSIRLRVLLAAGAGVALTLLLATWGLAVLFDRYVGRLAEDELSDRVASVVATIKHGPDRTIFMEEPPRDPLYRRPYSGFYWQIEGPENTLRSRSLWDQTLAAAPEDAGPLWHGELIGPLGGTLLATMRRIEMATPDGDLPLKVTLGLHREDLDAARAGFLSDLMPYMALLALALVAALAAAMTIALRPLSAIGRRVGALSTGSARRIGPEVPAEVLPLATEIDALLDAREAETSRARLRAGDLAHGLKTPLQALLGESARLRAEGDADAARAIEDIVRTMHAHVDRELARARRAAEARGGTSDARETAESVAAVLRRTPAGAGLAIEVRGASGLRVGLHRADLAEALGALAENAVRHAASSVSIACAGDGDRVTIRVRDDGPGAATASLDSLMTRGERLDERGEGTGLGLAIAADIARAAGGALSLRNLEPGFEAELSLPRLA